MPRHVVPSRAVPCCAVVSGDSAHNCPRRLDRIVAPATPAPCRLQQRRLSQPVAFVNTVPDGVVPNRADLERIFMNLRALIAGTGQVDPNRSFAVDIAIAITHAIDRESGDE